METERTEWSIVLLGSFNPAIFHPAWFELHDVISKDVAAAAETKVVHGEIAHLILGDISIITQAERFEVRTTNAPEVCLLDFVSKVFVDLLPHSKIHCFGINKSVHFNAVSAEKRVMMARELAPLKPWGKFGERLEASQGELLGGMMSLRMREVLLDDESRGHLEAKVEPSMILDRKTGIYVAVNRHFELNDKTETAGATKAISKLQKEFAPVLESVDEIINHLVERVN